MSLHQKNRQAEIGRLNLKNIKEEHSFPGTKVGVQVGEEITLLPTAYSGNMLIHTAAQLNGKIVYVKGIWSFTVTEVVIKNG